MKNIAKLTCLSVIFIILNTNAFCQHFGIKASGGISRIYGQLETDYDPEPPNTSSFSPSFQAGMFYQLPIGKRTSFGAELLYSKVQGAQTLQWNESYFDGTVSHIIYEDVSYLSLPLYVGLTFNKLTFNAGFQISHALSSTAESKVLFLQDGKEKELASHPSSNFPVRNFDFGPRAGIIYQLNNRLSMEGMFYYGLGDISYPKSAYTGLKIQQMTVGLRYALKDRQMDNLTFTDNQQFGIKISGGISQISNSSNREAIATQFAPSSQGGIYYNRTLGNGSSVGMELLFSQIEGKELWDGFVFADEGIGMVYAKNKLYRHFSYLSLPIYFGINIKKLTIHAGAQIAYAISASDRSKSTGTWKEQPYYKETTSDNLDIDKFDFGPRAGVIYPLTSHLSLEAVYYYGFNNIAKDGSPAWKLKVQQATLGVRYALWSKSKSQ